MKWNELRRLAEERGWYLIRSGRHDVYAHDEFDFHIEIERHGAQEVKDGIYHKLKKIIGF